MGVDVTHLANIGSHARPHRNILGPLIYTAKVVVKRNHELQKKPTGEKCPCHEPHLPVGLIKNMTAKR